ncbi:MAG TPA: LysR substrate-binding domain-containing protein [Caulobacteraceae bacterium]|jgi:DNA-binding transcriptional LysR family regulator|nr:LysR substrate-binding domain-containing protein [Caulobacteraceae bacterium]
MIDDYVLFAQVVQAGSLSAAGRSLRLSPAMVSKRLSRLEERLGTRLIHRTTRRLATTPAGQQFYEDVLRILDASRAAEELVTGRQGAPSGTLRVSAPTSFGRMHVAPHLKAFLDRHPAVRMELELDDTFSDLIGDRIDLAIRIGAGADGSLTSHRLAANRRVLCAAPGFLAEQGAPLSLKQLLGQPLLAAAGQMPWRLEGPEGPVTVAGESCLRTNSSEVVRELAVAGMGIALRSTWDVWRELAGGALVRVLPDYAGASDVAIFAAHPSTSLVMPNVVAFVQFLQDLYAAPAWESA